MPPLATPVDLPESIREVVERLQPVHWPGLTHPPFLTTEPDLAPTNILFRGGRVYGCPVADLSRTRLRRPAPDGFTGAYHVLYLRSGYTALDRVIYVRAGEEWDPDARDQLGHPGASCGTVDLDGIEAAVRLLREECARNLPLVWNNGCRRPVTEWSRPRT